MPLANRPHPVNNMQAKLNAILHSRDLSNADKRDQLRLLIPADVLEISDLRQATLSHPVVALSAPALTAACKHSIARVCWLIEAHLNASRRLAAIVKSPTRSSIRGRSYRDQKLYFIAKSQASGGAPAKSEGLTRVSSRGT
jgi:hypothetical protein